MTKKSFLIVASLVLAASCRKSETVATPVTQTAKTPAGSSAPATTATAVGEVGGSIPAYKAKNLDGSSFDLASQKGSVVLLNVWATWCPPCRAEIPELQKMHDQYVSRNFKVIGVSVDEGGADDVRKFVAEQKMTYPIALDPDGRIANLLQTSVLPTTVILDRNGKIVWKKMGMVDPGDSALNEALAKALGS